MSYVSDNRAWLEPYVRQLADMMGLPHWRIVLQDGWPTEEGASHTADMCVFRNDNYFMADLYIRVEPATPEDLRYGIAHEMVHLLTRDYDQAVYSVQDHVSPATWSVLADRMLHEMEQAVDAIAAAWAPMLPLPVRNESEEAA